MESAEDEYAQVNRCKLKLREDAGVKKKKKKRDKDKGLKDKLSAAPGEGEGAGSGSGSGGSTEKRTKAELAFLRMQEKMQRERIQQKAEMTHKQRVEKFNQHLDSLTEHFDIPKVSWTK